LDEERELTAALREVESEKPTEKNGKAGEQKGGEKGRGDTTGEAQIVAELKPRSISTDVRAVVGAAREEVLRAGIVRQ
jgi:hypothetical protein